MAATNFTVECADHGKMTHDEAYKAWECPGTGCAAWLPDEEVYRLLKAAPDGSPDPVQIVVT